MDGHYGMVKSISPVSSSHWRSHLGEQLIEHDVLKSHLKLSHHWVPLTPTKDQPRIDLLYVKYDVKGHPQQALVGEVKYARQGLTKKSSFQTSHPWYQHYFKKLARDYLVLAQTNKLAPESPYSKQNRPVKSGRFWRDQPHGQWYYSGDPNTLTQALREAKTLGQFYQKCAKRQCSLRSRLYRISELKNQLQVQIRDIYGLNQGLKQSKLSIIDIKKLKRQDLGNSKKLRDTLFSMIRKNHPNLSIEQVNKIHDREVKSHIYSRHAEKLPLSHTLFMALSDLVLNVYSLSYVAERNMGQAIGSLASGLGFEIAISYLMTNLFNFTQVSFLSEILGGAISGVLYTSLDWLNHGQINPVSIAQGMAYTLGSALSSYGAFTLAASYGIAGSGASIGTLSGAAATKATLAWYGGGTLASGGGGIMVGSLVLSGMTIGIGTLMAFGTKMAVDTWEAKDRSVFQRAILNDVINNLTLRRPVASIPLPAH